MNIKDFQDMMKKIYIHHDSKRGIKATYEWLKSEVEELGEAIEKGGKDEVELEFADVLAWLCSLANLLNVSLEEVALRRYSGKCPKCKSAPCICSFREGPR